jgi:hypothetical protein
MHTPIRTLAAAAGCHSTTSHRDAGLVAMCSAKGIIDIHINRRSELACKGVVVGSLAVVEPEILQ